MGSARFHLAIACLAIGACTRLPADSGPYAAISGVVLNDATGNPIRRAVVTLFTLDRPPLEAVTFTESNGAFGFTAIPPGKYRLRAEIDGFQLAWFGASTPARPPGTLNLTAGDGRSGITFRLKPLGSISGVVLDPDGDPLPNVQICLMRAGFSRRKPTYSNAGWATTDSNGRYRMTEVWAGQYVIMVLPPQAPAALIQPEVIVNRPTSPKMYAPDFYPDAARASAATPLVVLPGKEIDGVDFHLTAQAVTSLRGKVDVPDDIPVTSIIQINAFPQDNPAEQYPVVGTQTTLDHSFDLPNMIAGTYAIVATLNMPGRDYRALERLELSPAGAEITLHLDPAIDLHGRLDVEGDRPDSPFHVILVSGDTPQVEVLPPQAEVNPDGTFKIPNVLPGIWDINVKPVPRGGYIKAMLLGDQDVLNENMTIAANTTAPLRIVLSTRGGVVTGKVTVPEGVPKSPRARVLLAPFGKYAHVQSYYATTATDDAGQFEFKSVTPGRYKLYAFEELEPDSYDDPVFLKPFDRFDEAFDVPEGARITRQTPLIQPGAAAPEN